MHSDYYFSRASDYTPVDKPNPRKINYKAKRRARAHRKEVKRQWRRMR